MQNYDITKNYELTNYPLIYKKSYWGLTLIDNNDNKKIIKNRNNFIENFNIIKIIDKVPQYISNNYTKSDIFDHIEIYLTNDKKYIIVSSSYDNCKEEYEKLGWIKIYKLYSNSCYTYIKIIDMKIKNKK
jgi:hypothetical protein